MQGLGQQFATEQSNEECDKGDDRDDDNDINQLRIVIYKSFHGKERKKLQREKTGSCESTATQMSPLPDFLHSDIIFSKRQPKVPASQKRKTTHLSTMWVHFRLSLRLLADMALPCFAALACGAPGCLFKKMSPVSCWQSETGPIRIRIVADSLSPWLKPTFSGVRQKHDKLDSRPTYLITTEI